MERGYVFTRVYCLFSICFLLDYSESHDQILMNLYGGRGMVQGTQTSNVHVKSLVNYMLSVILAVFKQTSG